MNSDFFPRNSIKAFAIIIITNYHCQNLYPSDLKFLSTGAALGLCLFFYMAGFSSINSIRKSSNFFGWFALKFGRLYIPAFTFSILTFVLHIFYRDKFNFINLIYPRNLYLDSSYWFIGAILIYYIFLYILVSFRINLLTVLKLIFALFLLVYLYSPIPEYLVTFPKKYEHFLYFFCFIYGAISKEENIIKFNTINLGRLLFYVSFFYILFVTFNLIADGGFRVNLIKSPISHVKLFSYLAIFLVTLFVIKILGNKEFFKLNSSNIITKLSSVTLEIYLCQFFIINFFLNYVFPLNFILTLFFVTVVSITLNLINDRFYIGYKQLLNKIISN